MISLSIEYYIPWARNELDTTRDWSLSERKGKKRGFPLIWYSSRTWASSNHVRRFFVFKKSGTVDAREIKARQKARGNFWRLIAKMFRTKIIIKCQVKQLGKKTQWYKIYCYFFGYGGKELRVTDHASYVRHLWEQSSSECNCLSSNFF